MCVSVRPRSELAWAWSNQYRGLERETEGERGRQGGNKHHQCGKHPEDAEGPADRVVAPEVFGREDEVEAERDTGDEGAEEDHRCRGDVVDALQGEDLEEGLQRLERVCGGAADAAWSFGHLFLSFFCVYGFVGGGGGKTRKLFCSVGSWS